MVGYGSLCIPINSHSVHGVGKAKKHQCRLILIAPWWPRMLCFMEMLGWLQDIPLILLEEEGFLTQQRGQVVHPNLSVFGLEAWPLSSRGSGIKACQRRLQSSSLGQSDCPQARSIRPDIIVLHVGVIKGASSPIRPMYHK